MKSGARTRLASWTGIISRKALLVCLMQLKCEVSQLLEGNEYPPSSLVVPTVYRLMATSAKSHSVYFRNRDEDEYNDPSANAVTD